MTVHEWFHKYGESHQNPINKTIHWICIPLIMFSLMGMLWSVPLPASIQVHPLINLGTLLIVGAMIFYLKLSIPLAIGMLLVGGSMLYGNYVLSQHTNQLLTISAVIFFLAWVGQFIGHKIEGKKPSFFEDLQFLLVGPMWLLGFIYKSLGIKY
jgi:uncharacterized membrane protein YGL010W